MLLELSTCKVFRLLAELISSQLEVSGSHCLAGCQPGPPFLLQTIHDPAHVTPPIFWPEMSHQALLFLPVSLTFSFVANLGDRGRGQKVGG